VHPYRVKGSSEKWPNPHAFAREGSASASFLLGCACGAGERGAAGWQDALQRMDYAAAAAAAALASAQSNTQNKEHHHAL